jgi:phage integrase, N-terminal SAM-like domain
MNIKEAHTKFLEYLESIKNNSQKTVEQYDRHLKKFEEYLKEKGLENTNVEKLNLEIFEDFRASLYR